MTTLVHKGLDGGGWGKFSFLEQMGNIGSEVGRANIARKKKDVSAFANALDRALELIDLTLADERWKNQGKTKEIALARELLCSAATGDVHFGTSLEDIDRYFFSFALAARAGR